MIQLGADEAHINNAFGSQNVVEMMGMLGVQYSGFYGENFLMLAFHMLRWLITTRLLHCKLHIRLFVIEHKIIMIGLKMGAHVSKV